MTLVAKNQKSPINVVAAGPSNISQSLLEFASLGATGSDAPSKIQYSFLGLSPNIGSLTKGSSAPASSFTQADINNKAIFYNSDPLNKTVLYVDLKLRVTDLTDNSSQTITIKLGYPIPDGPPQGAVAPLYVKEGELKAVTQSQIAFTDLYEAPPAIFMRIQNWPTEGIILKNGGPLPTGLGPGSEFSMQDIIDGKIKYQHIDGRENPEDFLSFKVRDTKNKWTGLSPSEIATETDANVFTMKIIIQPLDLPITVHVLPLVVEQCETGIIVPDLLSASDEDDPTLPIVFKLTKLPLHGVLKKDGTAMVIGTTWTNADVAAGKITLEQDCSMTLVDEFRFDVDNGKPTSVVKDVRFEIQLKPNQPPFVEINPLEVPKCDTGVAGENHIKITDPEGLLPKDIKIKFAPDVAGKTPKPQHGSIRINGSTAIPGVTEFTYQDILNGGLAYVHDCTTHDPLTDNFYFTVFDGNLKYDYVLPIVIIVKEDKAPYMTENPSHAVERNGDVIFDVDTFDFTDDDTPLKDVFWELTKLPEHGQLFINGVPAKIGDKFKRTEWDPVQWRYVAGAPDTTVMEDNAFFKLYDGTNVVEEIPLRFVFPEVKVCPDVVNVPLRTTYGLTKAITELDLFARNEGIGAADMVWTLKKKPTYGELRLNDVLVPETPRQTNPNAPPIPAPPNNTWTSQDILDLKLSYTHLSGTPTQDELTFSVTNGFCAVEAKFRIDFVEGLRIVNNKVLEVIQSDPPKLIDTDHLLSTSGNVSTTKDIIYTYMIPTRIGITFLNGLAMNPGATFTQEDIDSGRLSYQADPNHVGGDEDYFKFSVTDGFDTLESIFKIKIKLTDRPPQLVINPLIIGELTCAEIYPANITVTDDQSDSAQLVFKIVEPTIHGTMYRDGVELGDNDIFTYYDILNFKISYCETEPGALLDSFDFILTDFGGNSLPQTTFPITIIPPPPPELINRGAMMEPCKTRAILPSMLNVKNLRRTFNKADMVFTITSVPTQGVIAIGASPLGKNGTFTLADILAGVVTYTGSTYAPSIDAFGFDVDSPAFVQHDNIFEIKFKQVNNPPWICFSRFLDVFEFETRPITLDNLQMCDVDLDRDSVPDVDPADGDDFNPAATYEEGQVIKPADMDEEGKVTKTVGLKAPGNAMVLKFEVTSGSARAYIRDFNGTVLVATPCQTPADGLKAYTFTPGEETPTITCQVTTGCVTSPDAPVWTFDVTSL